MSPAVQLDFFAANDLNGDVIFTMTDEDPYFESCTLEISLRSLGRGQFVTNRLIGDAMFDGNGPFLPEVFVRALIPAASTTRYQWGFFLDLRKQRLISSDEKGGEKFTIGGPGPLFYLSRAALRPIEYSLSHQWNLDRANGVFRWNEAATAGAVLNRIIEEDIAMPRRALVDLTNTFTHSQDSNGDPWTNEISEGADEFELPIGQSFLKDLYDIQAAEDSLDVTMNLGTVATPKMELNAWQDYNRDRQAADVTDFGSNVVHLKEGVNIESEGFDASGTSLRRCTHVIVHGLDSKYITVEKPSYTPGGYVKYGFLDYGRTKNENVLERRGLRWLRHQDSAEQEFALPIKPGFSEIDGLYFPSTHEASENGHVWIGDTVSVTTGTDALWSPLDFRAEPQKVTNITLELREAAKDDTTEEAARSWDVIIGLNQERQSDNSSRIGGGSDSTGDPSCICLRMCASTVEPVPFSAHQYIPANDGGGFGMFWVGLLTNQGGSGDGAAGTNYYAFKSGSPNKYESSIACSPGDSITVFGYWGCRSAGHMTLAFGTAAGGTAGSTFSGTVIGTEEDLHIDGPSHSHADEWTAFSYTAVAPAGTNSYALGHANGTIDFDEVYSGDSAIPGSNPLHGDSGGAAHCDHIHHHFAEVDPTVDDDADEGYPAGTFWVNTLTEDVFISIDDTAGAAVWVQVNTGGGGSGHVIQEGGTPLAAEAALNFGSGIVATDNPGSSRTDVDLDWAEDADVSTQAFGDAAATGTSQEVARGGHKHAMPADPVTAHVGAGDPHTQYALDSDLATHAGAADPHTGYQKESEKGAASGYASLDGSTKVPIAELPTGTTGSTVALGDAAAALDATHAAAADPHTGYMLESLASAKGEVWGASADNVPAMVAASTEGQLLVGRAAETSGNKFETRYAALTMVIGNGVTVIAAGIKGYVRVPFNCEIVRESILADQSGAIKIDVWLDDYANYPPDNSDTITGGNEPEIAASGTRDEDTTLTSWSKTLAEGRVLGINVDSCTSIKQVTFELRVKLT